MIESIQLTNFKQHGNRLVEFTPGLNVIRGDNGVGKTAIFKAICYALYGASAAGAKDHLTSWSGDKMSVNLTLTLPDEGRVAILRSNSKAIVVRNESSTLVSGHTPVTQFITSKLGMDGKTFKNLLYAEQGQTQALLTLGASALQRHLESIAGADLIDKILGNIKEDIWKAQGEIAAIGEIGDVQKIEEGLRDATAKRDSTRSEYQYLDLKVGAEGKKVSQLREQISHDLQPKLNQRQLLQQRQEFISNDIHTVRNQLQTLGLIESYNPQELGQCTQTIKHLEQKISNDISTKAKRSVLTRNREQVKVEIDKNTLLLPLVEEWEKQVLVIQSVEAIVRERQKVVQEASTALRKQVCQSCRRPFDAGQLAMAEARFKASEKSLMSAQVDLEKKSDQMAKLLKPVTPPESIGKVKGLLGMLSTRLEDIESNLASLPADPPPGLSERLEKLRQRQAELASLEGKTKLANDLMESLAKHESEMDKVSESLGSLPDDLEAQITTAQELLQKSEAAHTELQKAINLASSDLQVLNSKVQDLERSFISETSRRERLKRIESDLDIRKRLDKFLRDNRSKFMQDIWLSVTQYSSHLISSTTQGFMNHLSRNEAGDFLIEENERQVPVEELSGARRSIVGLCLRIALSRLFLGNEGFALLDEVTADCTEENAARVAGLLQSLNSQVIMVTHREGDATNAENVILL